VRGLVDFSGRVDTKIEPDSNSFAPAVPLVSLRRTASSSRGSARAQPRVRLAHRGIGARQPVNLWREKVAGQRVADERERDRSKYPAPTSVVRIASIARASGAGG